ncbi:hypothetical protein ACWF82_31590 [Nocardia sp. NPDC055053]
MISKQNSTPRRRYRDIVPPELITPPLIPFGTRQPKAPNRSLPAPRTAPVVAPSPRTPLTYRTAQLGPAGRILNRVVVDTLSWKPGTFLAIDIHGYLLITRRDESGETHVTSNYYFRIPDRRRRQANINIGDQVLLVADKHTGQLRIYPPTTLDCIFSPAVSSADTTR